MRDRNRDELIGLTGLRGLFALGVLCFHYKVAGFHYGYLGVDCFFVLSGFVLAHVYRDGVSALPFLRARAARTLPTHFVATSLVGIAVVAAGRATWGDVVGNLIGLDFVNPPTWSLLVEWYAYFLFPVVAYLPVSARIFSWIGLIFGGLVGISVHVLSLDAVLTGKMGWNIAAGLGEFTAGACLYRLGFRPFSWMRMFDIQLIRWIGDISYPLYLIQVLPLFLLGGLQSGVLPLRTITFGIAVTVLMGAALHYWVEQPARFWLRYGSRQRHTAYDGPDGRGDRATEAHHWQPAPRLSAPSRKAE